MQGTFWILSYVSLSLAVLWLGVAVLLLYRRDVMPEPPERNWPSSSLVPGQRLPPIKGNREGDIACLPSGDSDYVFVASLPDAPTAYAAILSAARLANEYDLGIEVVLQETNEGPPLWVSSCPVEVVRSIHYVPRQEFRRLGLTIVPVVGVVRAGLLKHAVAGRATPESLGAMVV
jgi:hypothetical protein